MILNIGLVFVPIWVKLNKKRPEGWGVDKDMFMMHYEVRVGYRFSAVVVLSDCYLHVGKLA